MTKAAVSLRRRSGGTGATASRHQQQAMRLTVTRLDADGRYETLLVRGDGVSFRVKGVAHTLEIPHDLAHYAVEKALQFQHGFWGSIADGAVFPSMVYVDGRRKPKAAERSNTLLKANAHHLTEAEIVVRIFSDTIEQGHTETSFVLRERLKQRWTPPQRRPRVFSPEQISAVFTNYERMRLDWNNLPVGGSLALSWPG